jgi:hypothetical protein
VTSYLRPLGLEPERFRNITDSTLEGLAKRELNLSAILGRSAEAKERRLVPEVIEDFFLQAVLSSFALGIRLLSSDEQLRNRPL